jgi:hypothetical protein
MNRFYRRQIRNQFVPMSLQELSMVPQAKTELLSQYATSAAAMENTPMQALTPDKSFALEQKRGLENEVNQFVDQLGSKGIDGMGTSFSDLQKSYKKRKGAIDAVNTRYAQYSQEVENIKKKGEKDPAFWVDATLAAFSEKVAKTQINYNPETGEFSHIPSMGYANYLNDQEELMKAAAHVAEEGRSINDINTVPDSSGYIAVKTTNGEIRYVDAKEVMKVVEARLMSPDMQAYYKHYQEITGHDVGLNPNNPETYWWKKVVGKDGKEVGALNENSYIGQLVKGVVDAKSYQRTKINQTVTYPHTLNKHINVTGPGAAGQVTQLDGVFDKQNPIAESGERIIESQQAVKQSENKLRNVEADLVRRGFSGIIEKYKNSNYDVSVLSEEEKEHIGSYINAQTDYKISTDVHERNKEINESFMKSIFGNNAQQVEKIKTDLNNKFNSPEWSEVYSRISVALLRKGLSEEEVKTKLETFKKRSINLITDNDLINSENKGIFVGVTRSEVKDKLKELEQEVFGFNLDSNFFGMPLSKDGVWGSYAAISGNIERAVTKVTSLIPKENMSKITSASAVQPYVLAFNPTVVKNLTEGNPGIMQSIETNQGGFITGSGMTLDNSVRKYLKDNGIDYKDFNLSDASFKGIQFANAIYPQGMWQMEANLNVIGKDGKTNKFKHSFTIDPASTNLDLANHNSLINSLVRSQIINSPNVDPNLHTGLATTYASMTGIDIKSIDRYLNFSSEETSLKATNATLGSVHYILKRGDESETTDIYIRNAGAAGGNSVKVATVRTGDDNSAGLTNILEKIGNYQIYLDNAVNASNAYHIALQKKLNILN